MTNKINDGGAAFINNAEGIHLNIAIDAFPNGATVKCNKCGNERELTRADCAVALSRGWPTCCGYSMTLKARGATMPDKLKPCPFCGSEDLDLEEWNPDMTTRYFISCSDCGADGPWKYSETEAIAAWNKRQGGSDD